MTKAWAILLLLSFLAALPAHSAGLKVKRDASPYQVEVEIDRNPLVVGSNRIAMEIRDGSGKRVTDAKVLVNYYMPPMPRMAPMNYRTEAVLKGETYRATMDFVMAGPWYIRIVIDRGGNTVTTKFNVDAQ